MREACPDTDEALVGIFTAACLSALRLAGAQLMQPEAIAAWLAPVPRDSRDFSVGAADARAEFGLGAPQLDALAAAGLACEGSGDDRRFDRSDLHFAGLRLGTAAVYLWAIRRWAESLVAFVGQAAPAARVRYLTTLDEAAVPGEGYVLLPGGERRLVRVGHKAVAAEARLALRRDWPALPAELTDTLLELAQLEFYWLPESIRGQAELVRRLRLAECVSATRIALEACAAAGFEARASRGLLLSIPCSIDHTWADVRIGSTWVPVDPLMLATMHRFGGLDAERWAVTTSPGTVLVRLGDADETAVTIDGAPVQTTFLTTDA